MVGTAIALTTILIKTTTSPSAQTPTYPTFTPPAHLPLADWQLISITPESETELKSKLNLEPAQPTQGVAGEVISTHHYSYEQNNTALDLKISYLVNTDGDLKTGIAEQTQQLSVALKQDTHKNHYGLFSDGLFSNGGNARLETCLNARGPATVTSDQFNRNRMVYDTRLARIVPWFTGQATLPDQRCLWLQLSTPLAQYSSERAAHRSLETAWREINRQISTF